MAVILLFVGGAHAAERPNVIVLLADDQGWGDLSTHGNTNLKTPHIDSLARDGASFQRFFVQPVCSPTRAEFLTGRYHPRCGVRGVTSGGERLNLDERTIADAFRKAGYATGLFGKWHNGTQYPYHPLARGFAEFYGFTSGHWGHYFDPPLDHNGASMTGKGYLADDITGRAIDWCSAAAKKGQPFFTVVTFNTPHSPMQVPDEYWNRFKSADLKLRASQGKEDLNHTRAALAMCENIDANVGRMLKMLHDSQLESNTIVVYFSDNGPNGWRWNGGMKGRKGSTDEGGVRSPLFIRWPGKIAVGTAVSPSAGAIDLLPTLLAMTGVERVGDKPLDGMDFSPWLLPNQSKVLTNRILFQHWNGSVSARSQSHRLDAAGKLYDMIHDPEQKRDIAADDSLTQKRLSDAVNEWKKDVLKGISAKDDRPYPVGHSELPRAVLPARDGTFTGGIRRSAGAPNCSYFTNWTNANDEMIWNIDVHAAGRYEAIIQYACSENNIGSTIELRLGPSKWTGTVTPANDPPLIGREQDRVPRAGESYMKAFKPLSLGTVELPKGTGTLTLKASKVIGSQVAEVKAVELILKP